ncbi:branched-chain amino acid ABC transporter permease [Oceanibacterium hippocampi]|uniref:Leucine/isoleucine/valine transporter permease subunit n=1 Tax=Oceanibacterium hippocampi TaxID=745714 RepID=A0A1Y5TY29_9PROT|nr:branched-chain amino acid ABC transporter permease [Oceanibacterium hippocampi]SLN76668.1 leucine/isoleucine/valine transporter permease subunit [Oceanibacterium hippocampi]
MSTRSVIVFLLVVALLAAAPFVVYPVFLMKALLFALFASAFNLLLGYVGLLSFGHAAFFGFAAYVSAHVVKVWEWGPEGGIVAGTAVAAALGLVFGWLAIRRQGIYFAMVTLALAQMVYFVSLQASFTHGEDGIQAVPRRPLFGIVDISDNLSLYFFVAVVAVAGMLLVRRAIHSPFGEVLRAIRENEQRARSLGFRVDRYKLLAFVLSAALAGVAGSTKILVFQLASLSDVEWMMSGEVVLMALIGGMGTVWGPALGAVVIVAMQNYLAQFGAMVTILQGIIFVAVVLLFRRGIVGEALAFWEKRRKAGAADDTASATLPERQGKAAPGE